MFDVESLGLVSQSRVVEPMKDGNGLPCTAANKIEDRH